ncbi:MULTISPECIES: S-layer family protein [unclassified Microcoleus]|uniref:beta strand repeat-containing protein n=1 Tax=unclassified Microcoleus TaxID=2642155 RepID=UPI001DA1C4BF|nr:MULTISPECIES: S-layer family protein [unclassified Microcoleus]TAF88946.1 MAG: S-layer family protein [Oscillatoriales cyanobacterium]MCC3449672.1 S-layer family protein [Microcoleus sp. PH2017_09_SFU_O_A]MCC3497651.1 S-layer family protein [Microcoleus sp. PH2017_15_JOR_U_A]MCC3521400.1 S-layer family protein [Microcoleus sp. PH2017_20_SFW_D_A]MCC3552297.1 S-layer family protein [Microcoleus sp. PH2017_35_SFW_U_B]
MPRLSSTLFFAFLLLFPTATIAQIIPDRTLATENSRTVSDSINNLPSDRIEGGASRGSSLFHSFREFNVGEGRGAYFANPNGIANIFTRVTGSNSSNILGTLGVQGNANLFLLNPKGIIFGPNARLDLRGSFIGSTADSIVFNNGFEFSSANPSAVPLLAINIPVGLRFRDNPGTIVNTSQAIGPTPSLPPLPIEVPVSNKLGLAVDPGQTLALIGGDIQLNGGNLTAYTGQILLGSVKTPGLVQFEPTALGLNLNYSNIQNFGNIEMNGALINTSGLGGGKIDIRGSNVTVSSSGIYSLTLGNLDGRSIDINAQNLRVDKGSQILSATLGDGKGNNLNIHATDSVEMSGLGIEGYQRVYSQYLASGAFNPFDPQIMLSAGTAGSGAAGNINIDTPRLLLRDGALGGTSTFTAANAGNLNIRANTVELIGSVLNSGTTRGSTGQGGSITVDAQRLIMRDGASLIGISRSDGASGNIAIKTNESVELSGSLGGGTGQTTLATSSFDGKGKAGDITIDTKRLTVSNGAVITLSTGTIIGENVFSTGGGPGGTLTIRASDSIEVSGVSGVLTGGNAGFAPSVLGTQTTSSGRGGDIRLSTPVLTVRDGGIITAASLSAADAGDITINADRTEVQGSGNNGRFSSRIEASAGRAFSFVNPNATGNAGSLNLNVNQLIIRDGATVNVASIGSGRAGNINVVADAIALDNKASIDGTTVSGTGANINLRSRSIQLRRNSRITTDAGNSDGGNIRINSDILLALPRENSDITANARTARGGQVAVNVPNIFGFTSINREAARSTLGLTDAEFANLQVNPTSLIPTSDIAAISQQAGPALQGAVTFSTSGVNPAQGLVELPQNVISPEALIVANPCTQGAGSEFTITGKGGIPANPNDLLSSDSTLFSWVEPAVGSSQNLQGTKAEIEIQPQPVIPAQGWVINADGQVTLVAYNQMAQVPQRSKPALPVCRER